MTHAARSIRTQSLNCFPSILQNNFGRRSSSVKFRQITTLSGQSDSQKNMDKANENNGDVMSDSFGEGYATRSDEEGLGGTCGGYDSTSKIELDKKIHENHPAYDKTQGSEVKEKEKGRHQTNATTN